MFYVLLFSLRCFVLMVKVCLKCVKFDVCFSVSGNLLISNVKPQHNGVYICRASTPGTRNYTNAAANLTVLGGYNTWGTFPSCTTEEACSVDNLHWKCFFVVVVQDWLKSVSPIPESYARIHCSNIQWGKKVFSQPPIVQVIPLKKMREACNFHHMYTSTMTDKMREKNPENHIVGFFMDLFANYGGK